MIEARAPLSNTHDVADGDESGRVDPEAAREFTERNPAILGHHGPEVPVELSPSLAQCFESAKTAQLQQKPLDRISISGSPLNSVLEMPAPHN